jgi:hypothetical protein
MVQRQYSQPCIRRLCNRWIVEEPVPVVVFAFVFGVGPCVILFVENIFGCLPGSGGLTRPASSRAWILARIQHSNLEELKTRYNGGVVTGVARNLDESRRRNDTSFQSLELTVSD